eukprot:9337221-Pyramimonas_sp.AAC.1
MARGVPPVSRWCPAGVPPVSRRGCGRTKRFSARQPVARGFPLMSRWCPAGVPPVSRRCPV